MNGFQTLDINLVRLLLGLASLFALVALYGIVSFVALVLVGLRYHLPMWRLRRIG